MADGPELAWDVLLDLGTEQDGPLHRRLADGLREAIRTGAVVPGSRLPSSRMLARDLGCSRWVVTEAYGQLVAEGHLDAQVGSATRVADTGPGHVPRLETRSAVPLDLVPGLPDLRAFPRRMWLQATRAVLDETPFIDLGYPDRGGHPRFREALAAYLARTRLARLVHPDAVTVTAGVADGVAQIVRAIGHRGATRVAVEDPGWTRLRERIVAAGGQIHPIPVDADGLDVSRLSRVDVDIVVTAAAHQFPTGVALSVSRREQLADWADRTGGLIIEDDYDAEFRYDRDPLPALQARAPAHVALVGSVSKTLAPALGLGWMVAPPAVSAAVRAVPHPLPGTLTQLTLARLLHDGGYDRHLRAIRRTFSRRRAAVLAEIERQLPGVAVSGDAAGLHVLVHLGDGVSAHDVARAAADRGVRIAELDDYRTRPQGDGTLVLGYANLSDPRVADAVTALAEVVRAHRA